MKPTYILSAFLLLLVPATAGAQSNELTADPAAEAWTIGVAPRIGLTVPTSELGAMVVGGLEIDFALPVLGRQLVAALDVTMTRPSADGSVSDPRINGAGDYDIGVTELKIGLDIIYRLFGPARSLVPFVGAGPVLHMLRTTQTTSFAPGENQAQNTELGFELLGGADYRLGPGYLLGEARLVYSDLDHLFTGDTTATNITVSTGYRLVF